MADRIMLAAFAWGGLLFIFNPFFEGRKRLIAMLCAFAVGTATYIAGGIHG